MLEKETLTAALQYTGCTELPEPLKEGDIFVRAIAKVKKANNHETMCIVVNDGCGKPVIKKDFGSVSMIKEVVEIYPLSVLENNSIPDFRKKKDIAAFLVKCGESEQVVNALLSSKEDEDKAALKNLVFKHCVKLQAKRESLRAQQPSEPTPEAEAPSENTTEATPTGEQEGLTENEKQNGNTEDDTDNAAPEETSGENPATDSDF